MKKLTREEFIIKARIVHGWKYDYSKVEYKNNSTKICIICPEHGEFWQTPNHHLQGDGCKYCSHQSFPLTTEEFIEKARKVHGDKYDYSKVEYKNNKTPVTIICQKHGEFKIRPDNHLHNHGCKKCKDENIHIRCNKGVIKFIEDAKKVHGDRYDYSKVDYIDNKTKVCIICPKHGEFWQTPIAHRNQRCNCQQCSETNLEEDVFIFLKNNNIKFEYRKKDFNWLKNERNLETDFYLPDYNIAIECQGSQHFEPNEFFGGEKVFKKQLKNDLLKKKLCNENGVKLLCYGKDKSCDVKEVNEILQYIKC